jgi:general stress protein 26
MSDKDSRNITKELKAVGVRTIGLIAPESKVLRKMLHDDELIKGVVYGKYTGGLAWLIATNKRIIFIDRKPFFTTTDELSYDIVAGVKMNSAGAFCSVILHTRMGDYTISYANPHSAEVFVRYIEEKRLETENHDDNKFNTSTQPEPQPQPITETHSQVSEPISASAVKFLNAHDLAVLSTIDDQGKVHGATVYYAIDQDNFIYIVTKSGTNKVRNIYNHHQVALTVHEQGSVETVQLQGNIDVETDERIKKTVFEKIVKSRQYRQGVQSPPITKINAGTYVVLKITPDYVSYHDFSK